MLTPTQFLREAALKTKTVPVKMGKVVEYADVPTEPVDDQYCWLCGGKTGGRGVPIKKAIKPTFTDADRARCTASQSICRGCAFSLAYTPLRNYSILATEHTLYHPGRDEIRNLLLHPAHPTCGRLH